ncbi:hypothetical protein NLU13_8310 [Sarocladium strictum]|uniref:Protein-lysine N-methyltransferase EFM5 n=1 Tax=Sarocladium strictum TaxID=5046 RepID=A0AA39GDS2_SARSR|nr:hypothetical protein NLU13_8310 [Sarocladium strictum]
MDSDDDQPTLSAHALAALAEFNAEKDERAKRFEKLKAAAEADGPLSMDAFTEDWNESQFWYADETAKVVASQLLEGATPDKTICIMSAPSAFVAVKNSLRSVNEADRPKLILLEHDERFAVFPEYQFYDFQQPFNLPAEMKGVVDAIMCDPPFLSEDCQTKFAMTARWLLKPKPSKATSKGPRVTLCTGERMQPLVLKLFQPFGVRTTTFEPKHARGLSNEFLFYANFECSDWKFRG